MNREPFLKKKGVQTLIASLLCIIVGLLIGFIALLIINPAGAPGAIKAIILGFVNFQPADRLENAARVLVSTVPLLMCSLAILYAYKVGLFNIGAAGQFVAGAGACIYCAVGLGWSWPWCLLAAAVAGALLGMISGLLKSWRNVNEVISGIMLNWISLYTVNMLLTNVKEPGSNNTHLIGKIAVNQDLIISAKNMFNAMGLTDVATSVSGLHTTAYVANGRALLPSIGLEKLFGDYKYVTIAIPLAVIFALIVWFRFSKTKLGYELRATGLNKNAAKYAGMRDNFNLVYTMTMSGALAGIGAALFYQSGMPHWQTTQSSVPSMGFNGIAAAFLGGLNPIGVIFSSYFIQHITEGGTHVDTKFFSKETADFITSVIIYLSSFVLFIRQTMNRVITNRNEKNQKRLAAAKQGAEASAENAPEPLDKETKDADAEKDESKKGGD